MDVIKSLMQADNPKKQKFTGMIDCMRKTIKERGIFYFSKGSAIIILRAFPINSLIFVTYETFINLFNYLRD